MAWTIKHRHTGEVILSGEGNLSGAYLRVANLSGANLSNANLRDANLRYANLSYANLSYANLSYAHLHGADLRYADLSDAYLRYADLRYADLRGANLHGAELPDIGVVPTGKEMVGYKKLSDGSVAILKIPANAKRTGSLIGKKLRAEFVYVVEGSGSEGITRPGVKYKTGDTVYPDKYCDDIRIECSNGINFFATKQEAES